MSEGMRMVCVIHFAKQMRFGNGCCMGYITGTKSGVLQRGVIGTVILQLLFELRSTVYEVVHGWEERKLESEYVRR